MANAPEPGADELARTIALARLVFGPQMNIQAPPNLSGEGFGRLIEAGLNDWGGVSPVTPDHVNPEAPWPQIERLRTETAAQGKVLTERLAVYPDYGRRSCALAGPGPAPAAASGDGGRRLRPAATAGRPASGGPAARPAAARADKRRRPWAHIAPGSRHVRRSAG